MDRETVEEIKRHFDETAAGLQRRFDETAGDLRGHVNKTVDILKGQDIVRDRLDRVETRLGGVEGEVHGLKEVVQRVHSELTGRLNDHDQRRGVLERKPAKGR